MKTIKNIKLPDGETYKIGGGLDDKITNCITEIPQDIKLELNNGVLTLKAGSKVYVPNGFEADGTTPKFDYVTVESDKSLSYGHNTSDLVWYNEEDGISLLPLNFIYSGSTAPSGDQYMLWYDTTNNQIKITTNSGASWLAEQSLPLGVIATSSSVPTSIDQTFNGFGYIGSTVFATKGVKGLIPNGRNEDGTLNNIEFTTDKIIMDTGVYTSDYLLSENHLQPYFHLMYAEQPTKPTFQNGEWFNTEENILYRITNGVATQLKAFAIGKVVSTGIEGSVVSFNPKLPFRALDYSNKSEVSGWAMPSNKSTALTLGAHLASYTAPANGYFVWDIVTQVDGDYNYGLYNASANLRSSTRIMKKGWAANVFVPAKQGDIVHIISDNQSTGGNLKFIYAEGEV